MAEILFDAPVGPGELTAYIQKYVPAPAQNQLTGLAQVGYTPDDKVRWGTITRKNRMAKYRAYDGAIARAQRDLAAESYIKLAPFSNSLMSGEYETLQKEFARLAGGNTAALADAIYNDAEHLVATMWNRVEKALGTALQGSFDVDENRTSFGVDFGIDALNEITIGTDWDEPPLTAADIADDLREMAARFVASFGVRPGRIVTSQHVVSLIQQNPQVVAEALGTLTGRARITRAELTAWLESENLPPIVTEVEGSMWNDETGLDERVLPENKIFMLPEDVGRVLQFTFGLSASALKLIRSGRTDLTFGDGTRITGMVIEDGPPYREYTYTDAVGIPILSDPTGVVWAEVY